MNVWMLEWFCSDDADYQFEALFSSLKDAHDYLAKKYPDFEYCAETQNDGSVDIWAFDNEARLNQRRTRLDRSEFRVTKQHVFGSN